jgi:putative endonuclease
MLRSVKGGWVYIMTNRPDGTLYVGVTANILRRAYEHRTGTINGFTKRFALHRLVYFEWHDDIRSAIQREKNLMEWPRARKTRLIGHTNPDWYDLYDGLS